MALRGVIFDMGGTLLHFYPGKDWKAMEQLGAAGWHAFLVERGYDPPDLETVKAVTWEQMRRAWFSLDTGQYDELTLARQLDLSAAQLGLSIKPEDIEGAVESYVAPVLGQTTPTAGAVETVEAVRARGLRTALVSNTMWPGKYHKVDLAHFNLLASFEATFFSADEGVWKPDPEIFRRALDALDLAPAEAMYIGDSRVLDVKGAQGAGLRGVWVENDDPYMPQGMNIIPDATVKQMPDLLPIIDAWM